MDRVENWDSALVEYAQSVLGQPFVWGRYDCASLVRNALRSMFGRDVWKGHVPVWRSERGALKATRGTTPEIVLRSSGAVETGTHYAWSGDVALGANVDDHGMSQFSILLPNRMAMTSNPETGVIVVDKLLLNPKTGFWRYE